MEDTVRGHGIKIAGQTAIPAGCYKVVVNRSARFKRDMPLLLDIPEFFGVRIHGGNSSADTTGCILVAKHRCSKTKIYGSLERVLTNRLIGEVDEHSIEIFNTSNV